MRKFLGLLFVPALFLVGCSATVPAAAPAPTVTVTATTEAPAPAPALTNEQEFVATVNTHTTRMYPSDQLVSLGHTICTNLRSGMPVIMIAAAAYDAGFDMGDAGYITGASVKFFCSDMQSVLDDYLATA